MKIKLDQVLCQIYVLPYIKITHDKWLNGSREFIIGWLNYQLVFVEKPCELFHECYQHYDLITYLTPI